MKLSIDDIKEIVDKVTHGGGNYTPLEAELARTCLKYRATIGRLAAEKEELLCKFRRFIDDHCLTLVTAAQAVENLSPNIQTDFYEEFIKSQRR